MATQDEGEQGRNYVSFGTEQPESALDVKAKERNKFLPVWKQEVRDEKGRKRLHGAFTGGFSAGFFNTVGSKEGFQPSAFISSRSKRSKPQASRPEDYMDEEDLEEIEASKKTTVTEDFDILGGTAKELERRNAASKLIQNETSTGALGSLPEKLIEDLIGSAKDSVGVKLIRQLGWREGQGVGPRRKRKRENGVDNIGDEHLYAPKDQELFLFENKSNTFGIGFNPHKDAPEFSTETTNSEISTKIKKKETGGFGVGIFEDDDDDDVYGSSTIESKFVFNDFEDGTKMSKSQITMNNKYGYQMEIRGSDGNTSLSGFCFSREPPFVEKWYAPLDVPAGWHPFHKFSELGPLETQKIEHEGTSSKVTQLNADQRRDILGEETLNAPQRSVFSFVSVKDQGRLQEFMEKAKELKSVNFKPTHDIPKSDPYFLDPQFAESALKGFMPFANDTAKQDRYKSFLKSKLSSSEKCLWPPHMNQIEINHEMNEFVKAAQLYRPLSGILADRFTSSATASASAIVPDLIPTKSISDTPITAASVKMYGLLTRTKNEWVPTRLLCKRFNVAHPYPEKLNESESGTSSDNRARIGAETIDPQKKVLNDSAMMQLLEERDKLIVTGALAFETQKRLDSENLQKVDSQPTNPLREKNEDAKDEKSDESEDDNEDDSKFTRPPMDIFKAIFEDSDSDSDIDEDQEIGQKRKQPMIPTPPIPIILNSTSPPVTTEYEGIPTRITFVSKKNRLKMENDGNVIMDQEKLTSDMKQTKKKANKVSLFRTTIDFENEEGESDVVPVLNKVKLKDNSKTNVKMKGLNGDRSCLELEELKEETLVLKKEQKKRTRPSAMDFF
ncbi:hypothetical protein HK096_008495 [Nowakowskiella sp. JEL0078]|nr:hypothetical protein HK096_008495 [Nowakowskiella sp. JEL0078]